MADDDLEWFTISYSTIYAGVVVVAILLGVGVWHWSKGTPTAAVVDPQASQPGAMSATFTAIDGTVKVKAARSMEWIAADLRTPLNKADLVRTGSNSSAAITFLADGTVVQVRPDSLITIEETSEDPATHRRRVAWHISSGDVNYNTGQGSGAIYEVSTPTLRFTAAAETDGGVRVTEKGDDVRVFRGSVKGETRGGEAITLGPRQATKVAADGKVGPRMELPAAPALVAPPDQAEVAYVDPARAITLLAWKPVSSAESYHVQLDRSPYFNNPLLDREGNRENQVQIRRLEPGKYYWRVAAVDRAGLAGPFCEFSRFTVRQPDGEVVGPPPPLTISALEVRANIVQVRGTTEPGASVTVNGQRVDVSADGTFNEFVKLAGTGNQDVEILARGRDGGVAQIHRTVVAGY